MEKTMEMRGMKRKEIVDYFISIGGNDTMQGSLIGRGWEVEIGQEKAAKLGSFEIPSTNVKFQCEEELFENMIYAFRLRFLKAGG